MSAPSSCPSSLLILSHFCLLTDIFLSSLCVVSLPLSHSQFWLLSLAHCFPILFPFSCFNLDFHHTQFCLSHSDSLSFYFLWWQSLIFTSLCLTTSLPARTAPISLCFPDWVSYISSPAGWARLHHVSCVKANNEKRNVWRNPETSFAVQERRWRRNKGERKRVIKD